MDLANANTALAENLEMPIYTANAQRFKAEIYSEYQIWDSASVNFNRALKVYQAQANDSLVAICYENMGNMYRQKKEPAEAMRYYRMAYGLFDTLKSDWGKATVIKSEGYLYIVEKLFAKAKEPLYHSLRLFNKIKNRYGQLDALNDIANMYYLTKEYDKAIEVGEQALHLTEFYHSNKHMTWALTTLYRSHKILGNIPEALRYLEQVSFNRMHTQVEDFKRRFLFYQLVYENQRKDATIKQSIIDKQETTQQFLYGFSALGLFLVGILWRNNRVLRQKNADISKALVDGQTLERKRVAAELHDNLGGTLGTIMWYLRGLDKKALSTEEQEIYEDVQSMINGAYEEIRALSHNLLPQELEKEGLVQALERLVHKLNESNNIRFELKVNGLKDRLGRKTEFELYSMTLELTNNIFKHSSASYAVVSLVETESQIMLTITDDGQGIKTNDMKGVGLRNVRNRVESLNGTLSLANESGIGTHVGIQIPKKQKG
ncbi:signal transduction histidine kinase [Rhabdobacter roseus]|uniref:Oxygen sensor histidine kinase NreB n=1 Tax=Rhabdobacter roseus TaxID=1655419 RepID=A0A840TIL8_9BACT|nr:sensor histidine kinase [Rhabdobacter roseus]MBB5282785.1 signal transduction histidine kinase [Rhabdobacter roseus]